MFVRINYEKGQLLAVAQACGAAPCSIILVNHCRREEELPEKIWVPVATPLRCRVINYPK